MKKVLYLVMCAAMVAVACEPTPEPIDRSSVDTSSSTFTNTSESVFEYDADGGHAVVTYTIENPVTDAMVYAEVDVDVDWLTDFNYSEGEVRFYVEANESEEAREAMVVVAYGADQSFTVGIRQKGRAPSEVLRENCVLNGSFNGRDTMAGTIFNYTVCFTDKGMATPNSVGDSNYLYYFDIYSDSIAGFGEDKLPKGVYELDVRNKGNKDSFTSEGSYYVVYGDEVNPVKFTSGSVTVTDEQIYVDVTTKDGCRHEIIYKGSKTLGYDDDAPEQYSTLTEDLIFNQNNVYIRCHYYGDDYGVGCDNWSISSIDDNSSFTGKYFLFTILVDPAKGYTPGAYLGEYKAYKPEMGSNYAGTFVPGTWRGFASYSWYVQCDQTFIDWNQGSAPIVDGTIKFEETATGVCITFDCVDDAGHRIQGTLSSGAVGEIYDVRDPKHPKPGF